MNSFHNLMKAKTERIWIEQNKDIHILNYWYYRYFTRRYMKFLWDNFALPQQSEQGSVK